MRAAATAIVLRVKTLWNVDVQNDVLARIGRLRPDTPPLWGSLSCVQMVVHITDAFALYTGELVCAVKRTPLQYAPLKQLVVYVLPMPKNVPTAAVLKARIAEDWPTEVSRLERAVRGFAEQRNRDEWPPHPLFGSLSRAAYGVLAYKHTDHHLRQFGT